MTTPTTTAELVAQVKANLILTHDEDDELICSLVGAATSYAPPTNTYLTPTTRIIRCREAPGRRSSCWRRISMNPVTGRPQGFG